MKRQGAARRGTTSKKPPKIVSGAPIFVSYAHFRRCCEWCRDGRLVSQN
jgi:hypothetical protein